MRHKCKSRATEQDAVTHTQQSNSCCSSDTVVPLTARVLCSGHLCLRGTPLFSQRPDIHQWLHHYTKLGVNKFYMYVPRLHYHEPHIYDAPHEVRAFAKSMLAPNVPMLCASASMASPYLDACDASLALQVWETSERI